MQASLRAPDAGEQTNKNGALAKASAPRFECL